MKGNVPICGQDRTKIEHIDNIENNLKEIKSILQSTMCSDISGMSRFSDKCIEGLVIPSSRIN